jgi:carboxylesterase
MATKAMYREVTRLPRDPQTGVVVGTEAVTLEGTGPNAALLVHGFVGSRIDYNDLGPLLQERGLTVRLMRLPGHGTFPVEHAVTTNDQLIEAVRREYSDLKAKYAQVALIGFSMGGALSALIASQQQVDRLVLIAPYFGVTHRWYYGLSAGTWNAIMGSAIPYVMKNDYFTCVNRPEAKEKLYCYKVLSTRGAGELIRLGKQVRTPEVLGKIQCPVLVLHSRGDRASSPKRCEKGYELIGSSDKRIVWYEDSNHHLLWDYDREAVKAEILGFLEPLFGPGDKSEKKARAGS